MGRKKTRGRLLVRYFICSECGYEMPATKASGMTHRGHIKHMYCPKCQKITLHEQGDSR